MNAPLRNDAAAGTRMRAETLVLNNEVLLYGIIDAWEVRALDVIAALAELRHLDTITVRINSPGGSIAEGLAIYDALRMSGRKIVVRVDALAGSIAGVIAMAGDEIVMAEDATLMIHNPWSYAQGEAGDLRKLADELDAMRNRIVDIFQRQTGEKVTREQFIEFMDAETYFTAQQAVELGLADRIDAPLKVAALAPDVIRNRAIDYFLTPASTENPASPQNAAAAAHHEVNMSSTTTTQSVTPAPQNGPGPLSNEAIMAEARAQVTEIYNACQPLGAEAHARAADMVNRGLSPDQARAEVVAHLVQHQPPQQFNRITVGATPLHDRKPFVDAVYAAMSGKRPEGAAAQYAGMTPKDIGIARLQALGMRVPSSGDQLFNVLMGNSGFMNAAVPGMHTTSDYPLILQEAGNRIQLDGYQAAQSVFKVLARRRTAVDFRAISSVRLGDPSPLTEVPESGEITHTTRTEEGESFVLRTFAKMYVVSRQMLINSGDLGAFADTLRAFGRAAAETEALELARLFTSNSGNGATLSDGTTLFATSRGNKAATGALLSIESLGAARAAMRFTKGLDGVTTLGLTPAFLVVGPALETEAEQILATINAATASESNPFSGKLSLLVEPRITDRSWRVFADPAAANVLAIAYLNDSTGPILDQRDGWNVLGTEYRAILDFGCGLTDWRGAYLNPGQ